MGNQPFYHLRPNKQIDRSLFVQTLIGLNRLFPIESYCYTGFGSYLFDDFKILHDTLNICSMVSLEREENEYERAKFNLPYNCIEIKKTESTEYLSTLSLEDDAHSIFWLDYVAPDELGIQLADYATLLNLLNPKDIVRITLNANPGGLGSSDNPDELQNQRLKVLMTRVPEEYFPASVCSDDVSSKKYPLTLLKILKKITMQSLKDEAPYSPNFMMPLFSNIYADGQQMLTFTGVVLNSHEMENDIRTALAGYSHNTFSWENPNYIQVPALSVREITEINKLLPNPEVRQQLLDAYQFIFHEKNEQAVDSYISYYKYYPNYHQVSF